MGAARHGVGAWAVMVLTLGLGLTVTTLVATSDTTEGFAGAAAAPAVVGNTGIAAQAFALGASNDTVFDVDDIEGTEQELPNHISLFHYGTPPDEDSDAAPGWLWPVLAVAPLLVFVATRRWLRRSRPTDAGSILGAALMVTVGFGVATWIGALLAPLGVGAAAGQIDDEADLYARAVASHPQVAATVGLSLLWAAVGAFGAAVLWARSQHIGLLAASSSARPAETPAGPPVDAIGG
jgi:hypothetical protein